MEQDPHHGPIDTTPLEPRQINLFGEFGIRKVPLGSISLLALNHNTSMVKDIQKHENGHGDK